MNFEPEGTRDCSCLTEKYQIMKKGDLLEYVKILSKDKKQKILGKRSADDMLVFEVTRVERKKRGRKAAEFNEIEK